MALKSKHVSKKTTLKVCRRLISHIQTESSQEESVDDTLRRLLKLAGSDGRKGSALPPLTTTIKISREVMDHIKDKAKLGESRDATLSRLLGVPEDDGNIREQNGKEAS